jgi:zinc and cadmium transporter
MVINTRGEEVMPIEWSYSIVSVVVVSLVSLIGVVTIPISESKLRKTVFLMVSLATGALFGDAFIHLLPEAFAKSTGKVETSLYTLAGIFAFFVLEKFLGWRHEHVLEHGDSSRLVGQMNLVADGLHNLIDGMLIGASYLVSLRVGVATTIAVVLHEIPHEIGNFGVLLHAGFARKKALFFNFLSASLAVVGTIIALFIGSGAKNFSLIMLPLTAGGFIYIAGSDLVPELHKDREPVKSLLQFVTMSMGAGLMLLLLLLE